jgi:hypothetical protein
VIALVCGSIPLIINQPLSSEDPSAKSVQLGQHVHCQHYHNDKARDVQQQIAARLSVHDLKSPCCTAHRELGLVQSLLLQVVGLFRERVGAWLGVVACANTHISIAAYSPLPVCDAIPTALANSNALAAHSGQQARRTSALISAPCSFRSSSMAYASCGAAE